MVAASAAASAATETLLYQEEQRKRQEAEAPVGNMPDPGGESDSGESSIDPEGLLTGAEAQEFGEWMETAAQDLKEIVEDGQCEGNPLNASACTDLSESSEPTEEKYSDTLEWCAKEAKNPSYVTRDAKKYQVTKMCWTHFDYKYDENLLAVTDFKVGLCFSEPWSSHGTQEWYCEMDKTWWKFKKRGWWGKYT